MASTALCPAVRLLRQLTVTHFASELSDRELLERFHVYRDDDAFAAIVRRHGPLVLGVSRRMLGETHAAEDVFQATFLVLVRRAGSLRHPERVGPWLYGVALRIARKARATAARRREVEMRLTLNGTADADTDLEAHEVRSILDEALAGLPEKYRAPLVLCHLEGRTVTEASLELGWPRGTVATRLTRGRERLRRGLVRRGLAPSAGALCALPASASVPARLSLSTVQTVTLLTAGKAAADVVPTRIAALALGGWNDMIWTKTRLTLLAALTASVLVFGIGAGAYRAAADEPVPNSGTAPAAGATGKPVAGPQEAKPIPKPAPQTTAKAERVFETQFRFFTGDPKGSLEAGTQHSMALPRARLIENQRNTISVRQDIPWGESGEIEWAGVKVECTAKFGKERGSVVLDLRLENSSSLPKSESRTELQAVTKHIRDTVRLGKAVKYSLGRDENDQPVWVELVVWEVKEVLVGEDGQAAER